MRAKRFKDLPDAPRDAHDPLVDVVDHQIGEIHAAWLAACDEAEWALDAWRASPGKPAYAVYRAAADRADAAQDELANAIRAADRTRNADTKQ
jgi:hypothetical protein